MFWKRGQKVQFCTKTGTDKKEFIRYKDRVSLIITQFESALYCECGL